MKIRIKTSSKRFNAAAKRYLRLWLKSLTPADWARINATASRLFYQAMLDGEATEPMPKLRGRSIVDSLNRTTRRKARQ